MSLEIKHLTKKLDNIYSSFYIFYTYISSYQLLIKILDCIWYISNLTLMAETIPAHNLSEKCIGFSFRYLYIFFTFIFTKDKKLLSQIEFPVLTLHKRLLQYQDHQQKILA